MSCQFWGQFVSGSVINSVGFLPGLNPSFEKFSIGPNLTNLGLNLRALGVMG